MSAYSELIKNFEKIRAYMRDFYVYGFKSRSDYDKKSSRTYDDERRRMESWLGEYMSFLRTKEGKNVFISFDSRLLAHNPLYRAWKAKSFTDRDITLHFIIFDILNTSDISLTLSEIMQKIDGEYLCGFENPMMLDESTVRKKLREYIREEIIIGEKQGKSMYYRRAENFKIPDNTDALHFYSEVAPCGVIGSFLLDKYGEYDKIFGFKHHYITGALDNGVVMDLFEAMHKKCEITAVNLSNRSKSEREIRVIPLRLFVSVQSGRQYLMAYVTGLKRIKSFRVDYLSDIRQGEVCACFDEYRRMLDKNMLYMWGINCRRNERALEYVEFTVHVDDGEEHIIRRLYREKRIGRVDMIDKNTYRFSARVYDTNELVPWIRSFICRIADLNFSNKTVEETFRADIEAMYKLYGIDGGGIYDVQ